MLKSIHNAVCSTLPDHLKRYNGQENISKFPCDVLCKALTSLINKKLFRQLVILSCILGW